MFRIAFFTDETLAVLKVFLYLIIVFYWSGSEWEGKMLDQLL